MAEFCEKLCIRVWFIFRDNKSPAFGHSSGFKMVRGWTFHCINQKQWCFYWHSFNYSSWNWTRSRTRSRTPGLAPYVLTHFQCSGIPIFGKSREIPDFRESGKFFPIFGNPGIYFGRDSRIPGFKIEIGNDFTITSSIRIIFCVALFSVKLVKL